MLAIMLLPVGQLAGIPIQQASAQNDEWVQLRDWGYHENGDGAWFEWEIFEDEGQYELSVLLYRISGQGEEAYGELPWWQNDSLVTVDANLPPGTYKIVLELAVDEEPLARDELTFTLIGVPLNIYLFGADEDTQVELLNMWYEYEVPLMSYEVYDGFVRYTFEIHGFGPHQFSSGNHPSFGVQSIYPEDQLEYVFTLEQSGFEVYLLGYDIAVENGIVSGDFAFFGFDSFYQLVFTDQSGNVIEACVEEIANDTEVVNVEIQCDLPAGAKSLRLDAIADGYPFPTNLKLHLESVSPPAPVHLEDRNPEIDQIDLAVQFTDSPDASDIALYMVSNSGYSVRYFPAGYGEYDFLMEDLNTYPGDRFMIRLIGSDGHEYISYKMLPLEDNISAMTGHIEFACGNGGSVGTMSYERNPSNYYCENNYEPYEDEELVPQDAEYRNGTFGWTLPDTGDLDLLAYDLYYANEDMEFIRGEVRINSPGLYEDGQVAYAPSSDMPQDAAYMAVVALLFGWEDTGQGYGRYVSYFTPPFFIPIGQEPPQPPTLSELKVNGIDAIPFENEPNQYTIEVEADVEEALISAVSQDGLVTIDGVTLGQNVPHVAVTLDDRQTDVTIVVRSIQDENLQSTYVLSIFRQQEPDGLVEESEFVRFEDGSYGYIPSGLTAGEVRDKFRFVSDAEAVIMNGEIELSISDPVYPGVILVVTLGDEIEEYELRFLSELLRPSGTEPISVTHVAAFVIAQATSENPVDVTGDGKFDREDVRLLLGETGH